MTKVPNYYGVYIINGAYNNTIGGDTAAKGNYITANDYSGVLIQGSGTDGNLLGGNLIGGPMFGNGYHGVEVVFGAIGTQIGSTNLANNTISGNGRSGVSLRDAHGTQVYSNFIASNTWQGVGISNSVGCQVLFNSIYSNTQDGVRIDGATATGNPIRGNSIFKNGGKGIGLMNGGNTEIAAPTITTASATSVSGTAPSAVLVAQRTLRRGSQGKHIMDMRLLAAGNGLILA